MNVVSRPLIRIVFSVFALVSFWLGEVVAETRESRKVLIAAENSWPPFSGTNGEGISFEIAKAAFSNQGLDLEIAVEPYKRALRLTKMGRVDGCWNVTRQADTAAIYHFGTEPLLRAKISFYYAKNKDRGYSSIESVPNGTRVGVILGYEYGEAFALHRHRFDVVEVSTQASLLKMLNRDRIDTALLFDKVYRETLSLNGLLAANYLKGENFYTSDIYIAFFAGSEKSVQLSEALDKGLREIQASGEYTRILNGDTQ